MLHVRRLVPVDLGKAQTMPQVYVPVTKEDIFNEEDKPVPVWQDSLMNIEVPIKVIEGKAVVAGLPTIISTKQGTGKLASSSYIERPPEFVIFAEQFFNLYYSGGSLANFLVSGTHIAPVSGWNLESVDDIRVNSKIMPTKAFVKVTISAPGIERLTQTIYLKIQSDKGSFLVEDVSSIR